MFRLLIATRDPRVEEMFASMEGLGAMGYKAPHLRRSAEEAVLCVRTHHIDAVAVDKDAEFDPLYPVLEKECRAAPIFPIADSAQEQLCILKEVSALLCQLHADNSDDGYDEAYHLKIARSRWMRKLLSGMAPTRDFVLSHLRMYRCVESPDAPCLYARLAVPAGDSFLSGRWHYGSERLETALRNFFGEEHDRMTLHVAMVSPEEIRVLACPKPEYGDSGDFTAEKLLGYIAETIEQIDHYLGLSMNIIDIRALRNLAAFAADQQQA